MTVLAEADTDQVDSASEATSERKKEKTVSQHATLLYRDTLSARAETRHGQ